MSGFGVYVHWPFCKAKCPYCDFNSHVRHGGVAQDAFVPAYLAEIDHFAARTPGRTVKSVFFGGGTPSLMQPATVAAILERIAACWTLGSDAEITLEANPTSVEQARFSGFRAAGVNRVSLGLQALNDADLKALGRQHTADEALAALDVGLATFDRVSGDLIYARPGQSVTAWEAELARALGLGLRHLSLYQLTIEPGTAFGDLHAAGKLVVPDDDVARDLYDATTALTAGAGLAAYEVSNYAAPGEEARHNLLYWRAGEYAGIGPGAHARIDVAGGRRALATELFPEAWRERVLAHGHGLVVDEPVTPSEHANEALLMGLRLTEGIDLDGFTRRFGLAPGPAAIRDLAAAGLVHLSGGRFAVTPEGRPVLNAVLRELTPLEDMDLRVANAI